MRWKRLESNLSSLEKLEWEFRVLDVGRGISCEEEEDIAE